MSQELEKPQSLAFWKLHNLKGAFVNETSGGATLTIQDKQKWNEGIPQMQELFWSLIKEAYERTDEEVGRQLQISFENVHKIFIKTDGTKVLGFLCVENVKSDPSVAIIRDVIVRKELQNKGLGKELYASLFSQPEYRAVISATTTLAAEMNRFNVGNTNGFESYYGTMKSDNPDAQKKIERLRELDTEYLKDAKVLADGQSLVELNGKYKGLVLTTEDYIPRLSPEEVATMPDGPLKEQGELIIAVQKRLDDQLGKDKAPVVAGHLISIRQENRRK